MSDVIARLHAQGDLGKTWEEEYRDPKPLSRETLAALRLPSGEALPVDLAEWLRYDASWFPLLKKDGNAWRFRSEPVRDLLQRWEQEMRASEDEDEIEELEELEEIVGQDLLGYWIKSLPEPLADAHTVVLPNPGSDQEHLLMLEPARTSLRVLGCHKRIEFWWKYPSFAAYLAHVFGFEEPA